MSKIWFLIEWFVIPIDPSIYSLLAVCQELKIPSLFQYTIKRNIAISDFYCNFFTSAFLCLVHNFLWFIIILYYFKIFIYFCFMENRIIFFYNWLNKKIFLTKDQNRLNKIFSFPIYFSLIDSFHPGLADLRNNEFLRYFISYF